MKSFISILLIIALSLTISACTVESVSPPVVTAERKPYHETVITTKSTTLSDKKLYLDGLFSAGCRENEGILYAPLSPIAALMGFDISLSYDGNVLHLSSTDFDLRAVKDDKYICVNGRYFYNSTGFIVEDNNAYFPADCIDWMFNVSSSVDENSIDIDTPDFHIIPGGLDYYSSHYSFEDIYWLSHIIYVEAMNEPLDGLIGVGNVVLNRRAHPLFPDTIYSVVYDSEYRVQFEATLNGALGDKIDEISLLAAYMCLEGCNTVGKSIYFINTEKGSDAWLRAQKQFVVAIGKHDFYSEKESNNA